MAVESGRFSHAIVDEDPDDEWRLGIGGTRTLIADLQADGRFDTTPVYPYD
ncbi:hypothetical protein [Mumia sp. Pv 4-285]|uniref:hypothetical protein n=1 Tax=Mumia qirimensis TaxID=3234852 RepID=UPI00351CFE07